MRSVMPSGIMRIRVDSDGSVGRGLCQGFSAWLYVMVSEAAVVKDPTSKVAEYRMVVARIEWPWLGGGVWRCWMMVIAIVMMVLLLLLMMKIVVVRFFLIFCNRRGHSGVLKEAAMVTFLRGGWRKG
ncbi:hypothetical protein BZA05DRAFT_148767 [Tricharina praecox]|uniref:uncharacterized protein n=1 Tax=Tricharina praecox TaxID=43433 RepID=UPI00222090ED|nr:uncharacterized protein BZA05DRAFT_148767 [Tricharina praecox]KAI5845363.1 hypothetical protein BZA05DRAFT_148767 [Tricharina praecox]